MDNIYTSGKYLETTKTWHAEDSAWKARQINNIIAQNKIMPKTITEVGCGAGEILYELSKTDALSNVQFAGYDVSRQAIDLAKTRESERIKFFQRDLFLENNTDFYDILLVIDVFEHVQDYIDFLNLCREKAEYKIYHIPLDIHVSSVLRGAFVQTRDSLGHLHYFTAETAIATLNDTNHKVIDSVYTCGAFGLFKQHPSIKRAVANVPRWLLSRLSVSISARMLGGYSLLVLTT